MKTSRNCIHHSGPSQRSSRHLRNQDGSLMWDHIYRLVYDDIHRHNPKILKLTLDHINLSSYSAMKVSYATQVLSSSVANLLNKDYPGTEATAKFCKYFFNFSTVSTYATFMRVNIRERTSWLHMNLPMIPGLVGWKMTFCNTWKNGKMRLKHVMGISLQRNARKCLSLGKHMKGSS